MSVRHTAHYLAAGTPLQWSVTGRGTLAAHLDTSWSAVGRGRMSIRARIALVGTGDLDATSTSIGMWGSVRFAGDSHLSAVLLPKGDERRVVAVANDGTPVAELEAAVMGAVSETLNEPVAWSFALPVRDPKAAVALTRFQEFQLWRGDELLTWGPAIRPTVGADGLVSVEGADTLWHLGRRFVGRADRHNYVNNGGFEDGLAGWSIGANEIVNRLALPNAAGPPTATIVAAPVLVGRRALRVEQTVADSDTWVGVVFGWTTDPLTNPDGDEFTFRAYAYIEDFDAPAFESRGIAITRSSSTELDPDPIAQEVYPGITKVIEIASATLDDETPRGQWVRLEVTLEVPPTGDTEIVSVRLYGVAGSVVWDEVSLTLNESLRFRQADQTSEIAAGLVEHAQDPAYGKSDLNITVDAAPSGVLRDRTYVHAEHPNVGSSIAELVRLGDGFDQHMRYTPEERVYVTSYPTRGGWRPKVALEHGRNCTLQSWAFDGEAAASSVIALGQGEGSDREEGWAVDTSAYANGLTVEAVVTAAPETPIDALDNLAAELLAVTRQPVILTMLVWAEAGLRGRFSVGDVVPVTVREGELEVLGERFRVVARTLNPDNTYTVELNQRDTTA